jgi:general secretion pathway protein H
MSGLTEQIVRKWVALHLTPGARCETPHSRDAQEGALLIELLVVLAILALVSTIALPRASRGPSLGLVASDIAAKLRAARTMAIAQNRDVAFAVDTERRSYGVAGIGAPRTLPTATDLSVTAARPYIREAKEIQLIFFSDGTSSGGTIRLTEQHQSVAIGVEWLTGAVHIERGAP